MLYQKLGSILLESGCITGEQLRLAEQTAHRTGQAVPALLLSLGMTAPQVLDAVLSQRFGIGYWAAPDRPDSSLCRLLSPELAQKYRMVPVALEDRGLRLAMADPMDLSAADAASHYAGRRILPMLAAPEDIDRAISWLYGADRAQQALADWDADQDQATVRLVDGFLEYAVSQGASDIHLEPREDRLAVRLRLDGRLRECFQVPKEGQDRVIARVKVMAELDTAQHRLPQDGRSRITLGSTQVELRISTVPTVWGEKAVIRLLHRSAGLLTPEGIGLTGEALAAYRALLTCGSGLILLAGPTGAGKSATMYTMIAALNTEEVNLVTLEDPVEYHIPRINQIPIREQGGMRFADALRSVLRQDPDIIAVGEIRDPETARIAIGAAITGHLVLSTIHCADAPGAIDRLRDMGIEDYLIAAALRGVIAQRLVRKICPACADSFRPTPREQQQLGLLPAGDRVFRRGRGCTGCFQSGYRGRTGAFEVLTVSSALRRLICDGANADALTGQLAREGHKDLARSCARLAEAGITTAEEALHVIRSAQL